MKWPEEWPELPDLSRDWTVSAFSPPGARYVGDLNAAWLGVLSTLGARNTHDGGRRQVALDNFTKVDREDCTAHAGRVAVRLWNIIHHFTPLTKGTIKEAIQALKDAREELLSLAPRERPDTPSEAVAWLLSGLARSLQNARVALAKSERECRSVAREYATIEAIPRDVALHAQGEFRKIILQTREAIDARCDIMLAIIASLDASQAEDSR